jgi:hypothetical protein
VAVSLLFELSHSDAPSGTILQPGIVGAIVGERSIAVMGLSPSKPDQERFPTGSLRVIAAGYSRTGTESMTVALEKLLGGPVAHGGTQGIYRTDGMLSQSISP